MKRRRQRPAQEVSLSFLDVISCGFGAIVLLMLIAKTVDPSAFEAGEDLEGKVRDLQEQVFDVRGEAEVLNRDLISKEEQLSEIRLRVARLQAQLASLEKQQDAVAQVDTTERDELTLALQVLTEEMQRLLGQQFRTTSNLVGGIPVDSEYIVFIIDTSGSMVNYAWPKVREEMVNILEAHRLGAVTDDFAAPALTRVLESLTTDQVEAWKSHAAEAARALSAETQVEVWSAAINTLAERAEP